MKKKKRTSSLNSSPANLLPEKLTKNLMKRKKRTSSLNSSLENLPPAKLTRNPTKRKKRTSSLKSSSQVMVDEEIYSYLPDECWEVIFKFIINDDDDNNNRCNLNSLSLVSKQFLSITNCLVFSLTVVNPTLPFLRPLFKRFTDLNSIDLSDSYDLDKLLREISSFPSLKLTSLNISYQIFFPYDGLQAFSQNITTLTSLTCSNMYLDDNNLVFIADFFPLLKELNLSHTLSSINYSHLSKCRCLQHLDLSDTDTCFLDDEDVAELSLFFAGLVSINLSECHDLTESALFSLVRNCPSLSEIKMGGTSIGEESVDNSGVYPQLKSLYLGKNQWLSDEDIIIFSSNFPNLQLLDMNYCNLLSEGISQVLRRCGNIRHLNLARCSKVKLAGMNFVVPKLEVLNLSFTKVDDKTLYRISKNCCGLLKLFLNNCDNITEKGVKHVVENCTRLRQIYLGDFHLSDNNKKLFSRRGCLLC